MQEIVLQLIAQLNSSVAILMLLVILAFWATYKLGGILKSFNFFEKNNSKFESNIDTIKNDLSEAKATVNLLYQAHLKTIESHSPINLSEIGKKISSEINAEQIVINHWDEIKSKIDSMNVNNPYDVQTISLDLSKGYLQTILTEDEKSKIKNIAFEKGMNLLQIYPILGVIIRDKILQEKNIKIEDIDKHDPNKKI